MTLRLIQCCLEFCDRTKIRQVGQERRGIYVLYKHQKSLRNSSYKSGQYDVLYVGMADSSIRARLRIHARNKDSWTHFSAYAVWPNITKGEIIELEGLFRHLYRYDSRANVLNLQRRYKSLKGITAKDPMEWQEWTKSFSKINGKRTIKRRR